MIRLLLIAFFVYFLGRMAKNLLAPEPPSVEIHGKPDKPKADVNSDEIEDVEFKEIK
ncbi:MAG: hypothetical protein ONB12_07320 [candidate division KSB1 bacterium]|nr:hypothetical protein [candidate division KSB1 bacterium]